ncbi:GCN5-like protein 1-domain-containing protein, partial [Neocallimastix sp. 'constans']
INSISILFKNEKKLETESNKLQSLIKQHSKDVLQWNDLTKMLDNSLKELGDVQNWVDLIERDMKIITSTLEFKCQAEPTQLAENAILRFDTAKYDDQEGNPTPTYKNHPLE